MKKSIILGNSVSIDFPPIDLHKETTTKTGNSNFSKLDTSWLKSASKVYNVSDDIRDYILVPNPVVTTSIPNMNMQGFDSKILLEFDLDRRRPRYKTFVGTPTHIEHDNQDVTKAKGVNFDATMISIPKYNLGKVVVLSGFDRTKDSYLCNKISSNKVNGFSMGATTSGYICSICGGHLGPGIRYRTCNCNVDYEDLFSLGSVINGKLQYLIALNPVFFENSWVENPADFTALSMSRL